MDTHPFHTPCFHPNPLSPSRLSYPDNLYSRLDPQLRSLGLDGGQKRWFGSSRPPAHLGICIHTPYFHPNPLSPTYLPTLAACLPYPRCLYSRLDPQVRSLKLDGAGSTGAGVDVVDIQHTYRWVNPFQTPSFHPNPLSPTYLPTLTTYTAAWIRNSGRWDWIEARSGGGRSRPPAHLEVCASLPTPCLHPNPLSPYLLVSYPDNLHSRLDPHGCFPPTYRAFTLTLSALLLVSYPGNLHSRLDPQIRSLGLDRG